MIILAETKNKNVNANCFLETLIILFKDSSKIKGRKKQEIMKIKLENQDFILQYVFLKIIIGNILFHKRR